MLCRLVRALEPCGVLYASFRYGDGETMRDGRLFTDYREETFRDMVRAQRELRPVNLWQTVDARPGRTDVVWLNALLRKVAGQPGADDGGTL